MAEPTARHVFLSPHYDDVALSCGGTVARLAGHGAAPLIVTVMGGTPTGQLTTYARDMHERWGVGPGDAVAMRRHEERCAETALGAQSIWLDFLDAIYRDDRYLSDPDIFGRIHPDETNFSQQIVEGLTQALGLSQRTSNVFYVPLAVGNHVDHQHVLAAGTRLAKMGHDVWAYEDFPYAGDPEWQEAVVERATQATSGTSRIEWLSPTQLERRVTAIQCYKSQLEIIFRFQGDPTEAVRRYAQVVGDGRPAERFWRL